MAKKFTPPFLPWFGVGAPGAGVPTTAQYFDTATIPFTPYIYHAGGWQAFGGGGSGGNAIAIQGVAVDPTAPLDGQVLVFNHATGKWTPGAGGGGGTPTIVQTAIDSTNTVTFAGAPTKGNLLVCVFSHFSNAIVPFNPVAGKGWANYSQTDGSATDGFGFFYKIAQAGETAAQQPLNSSPTGITAVWEINGAKGFDVFAGQHDLNATPSVGQALTTTGNNELILALFATANNNLNLPTGTGGGFVSDKTTSGNQRAGNMGHVAAAAAGTFTPTATWAANPTAVVTAAIAVHG